MEGLRTLFLKWLDGKLTFETVLVVLTGWIVQQALEHVEKEYVYVYVILMIITSTYYLVIFLNKSKELRHNVKIDKGLYDLNDIIKKIQKASGIEIDITGLEEKLDKLASRVKNEEINNIKQDFEEIKTKLKISEKVIE